MRKDKSISIISGRPVFCEVVHSVSGLGLLGTLSRPESGFRVIARFVGTNGAPTGKSFNNALRVSRGMLTADARGLCTLRDKAMSLFTYRESPVQS